jgi:hypothetical protein
VTTCTLEFEGGYEELGDVFGVYKKSVKSLGIGTYNFRDQGFGGTRKQRRIDVRHERHGWIWKCGCVGMSLQSLFANKTGK